MGFEAIPRSILNRPGQERLPRDTLMGSNDELKIWNRALPKQETAAKAPPALKKSL
jgi:hypothetical protein